jgi:hypothetical protein
MLPDDYKDAIAVQDACNLSGVAHNLSRIMTRLWDEARATGKGTDWVNKHPIVVLYAAKLYDLAGAERNYSAAYNICTAKADGEDV